LLRLAGAPWDFDVLQVTKMNKASLVAISTAALAPGGQAAHNCLRGQYVMPLTGASWGF
jgi:hypothetical protein